jgi:hypothetical protein
MLGRGSVVPERLIREGVRGTKMFERGVHRVRKVEE